MQEQTVKKSVDSSTRIPPIRFESVSAMVFEHHGNGGSLVLELGDKLKEHLKKDIQKLTGIRFSRLLSYSYRDEFMELISSKLEWLRLLELKSRMAISMRGACTNEIINSLVMLTGVLSDMFVGVDMFVGMDRVLTKLNPMAAHFRCQGQAIRSSLEVQGFCTVPLDLLFASFDQRRHVVRPRGAFIGEDVLLANGGMATAAFVIRDYVLTMAKGRRIRKLPLEEVPSGTFDFLCHIFRDLLTFVPPSGLPTLFLHVLGIQIVQDLACFNGFEVEISVLKGPRGNEVFGLSEYRITKVCKGDCELTMTNVVDGVGPSAVGALPVFHRDNFSKIMASWRASEPRGGTVAIFARDRISLNSASKT
jgi:hypothetical protein